MFCFSSIAINISLLSCPPPPVPLQGPHPATTAGGFIPRACAPPPSAAPTPSENHPPSAAGAPPYPPPRHSSRPRGRPNHQDHSGEDAASRQPGADFLEGGQAGWYRTRVRGLCVPSTLRFPGYVTEEDLAHDAPYSGAHTSCGHPPTPA